MDIRGQPTATINGKLQQDDEWLKSLQENVNKSSCLRNQIIAMLESFEERLTRLDQTVLRLHERTALLQTKQTNIAKALKTIDAMQLFYGRAAELESSIREGNVSLDREQFLQRMEQMAEAISFFSSQPTYRNQLDSMKLTFESGCCALEKEFRNVVQADSMVADAALIIESLDQEFEVIPARLQEISTLRDVQRISQLARWLLSRNPNGSVIQSYSSVRADNMLRTLATIYQHESASRAKLSITSPPTQKTSISLKQALKKATGRSSERFGNVRDWRASDEAVYAILLSFGALLALIQIETDVMNKAVGDVSAEARIQREMFALPLDSVVERAMRLLNGVDCSLVPLLPLLKHTYRHYNQLLSLSTNAVRDIPYEEFVRKLQTRCSNLLDEFLERLTNDSSKFVPDDGNVHQVTSNTLNFLGSLMEYRQTVTQVLTTCSPGSNPSYLLPRLFARILSALGLNLKNKAENYNDETLAAIFLLNNDNYIHNTLQNDGMFAIVCEHNSEVRSFYKSEITQFTNKYLQSWNRVLSTISQNAIAFDDKQALRSALLAFNVEFDKLLSVQRNYCLADVKLSREIRERIKKAVCDSYADFYARINRSPHSKSFEKHLKYTPESLEVVIDRLFDVTA
uniref:Exocyst complex component 7 n=1 Tax=Parascaris univalens TaxID=6257 RepID=A0A915AB17_PARUN